MTSLDPAQFRERLIKGEISPPLIISGMVKADSDDADHLFFARSCDRWIKIPISLIEQIRPLSQVPCDDHYHNLVDITLKYPESPEGRLFAELLNAGANASGDRQSSALLTGPALSPVSKIASATYPNKNSCLKCWKLAQALNYDFFDSFNLCADHCPG